MDCKDCDLVFYDIKLTAFGSTFFRDLKTSENKVITIQECSLTFKNLQADTGWELISKNSTIYIKRSSFIFESDLRVNFRYFLQSSADNLTLKFESYKFQNAKEQTRFLPTHRVAEMRMPRCLVC